MSTHNIHFMMKRKKNPELSLNTCNCFLALSEEFPRDSKTSSNGTQKRVRISHGKRVTGVRVIEILLYVKFQSGWFCYCLGTTFPARFLVHTGTLRYECTG